MAGCCDNFTLIDGGDEFKAFPGLKGDDGTTFYPHVSEDGTLSWTNNGGLPNPDPVRIEGADGKSAYEAAVEAGYTGTEEEFNATLANIGDVDEALNSKAGALTDTISGASVAFVPDKTISGQTIGVMVNMMYTQSGTGVPSPDNVRPFTGFNSAQISHSGEDTSDPTVYTVNFPGTCYGGYFDAESGVLSYSLDYDENLSFSIGAKESSTSTSTTGRVGIQFTQGFPFDAQSVLGSVCDSFAWMEDGATSGFSVETDTSGQYPALWFHFTIPGDLTDAQWKARMTEINPTVIVPFSTPYEVQLSPVEISAIVGQTNHVWSNATSVSVEYTADLTSVVSDLKEEVDGKQEAPTDAGAAGQVLGLDDDLNPVWLDQGGGGGGTTNYNNLTNKPRINGVLLSGDKSSADLGLASASDIPTVPVQSVNGEIGAVVLDASDVGAVAEPQTAGIAGQVLGLDSNLNPTWVNQGGGGSSDYNALSNKPQIEGVTLSGNKTASDLGLALATDIPTVPVQSVNGKTGVVVLTASDVGAKPSSYEAPVSSVNSKTGAVVLSASDVGALPSSTAIPSKTSDLTNDSGFVNAAGAAAAAPVQSVNGSTGAITVQPTITASGLLKGNGSGGVSAAAAGTDYQTPFKTTTLTIETSEWTNNSVSKTVSGMTATALVFVEFSDTTTDYTVAQSTNTLTFTASPAPSSQITVKVGFFV